VEIANIPKFDSLGDNIREWNSRQGMEFMPRSQHDQTIAAIAAAPRPPVPWQDATQLPWDDLEFSKRMLAVHLDQTTHMASRTLDVIERHVDWLQRLLHQRFSAPGQRRHVLDLGCGPGFYCHELARHGARATGCDYAPAPIAYAREVAEREKLECCFLEEDLNRLPRRFSTEVGPVDAITFWFGEFHSFPPAQAVKLLRDVTATLKPGGLFILEYQPYDLFPREGSQSWSANEQSVFSDTPHLWLQEFHWDEETEVEIQVHWIIDAATGQLSHYAQCHQTYREADLVELCASVGLGDPQFHPPIVGIGEQYEFPLLVLTLT
jgi:SAM-dependent methyltransferase